MTLADTFDRELAAIPKSATRRYIAERLAKVAAESKEPQPLVRQLCVHPLSESDLLIAEVRRMRQQITDLRDEVAKLKAERGAL